VTGSTGVTGSAGATGSGVTGSGMTGSDSIMDLGFSSSRKQNEVEITPDTIVIIYSPRCGHCREAMPEFEKAVQRGNGKVVMVESDHPQGDELMNEAGSNSVPTIVKGLGTGKPIKYEGTRTADDILAFQSS
jgi:thioredoxin-like negative regulator of GroEL